MCVCVCVCLFLRVRACVRVLFERLRMSVLCESTVPPDPHPGIQQEQLHATVLTHTHKMEGKGPAQ